MRNNNRKKRRNGAVAPVPDNHPIQAVELQNVVVIAGAGSDNTYEVPMPEYLVPASKAHERLYAVSRDVRGAQHDLFARLRTTSENSDSGLSSGGSEIDENHAFPSKPPTLPRKPSNLSAAYRASELKALKPTSLTVKRATPKSYAASPKLSAYLMQQKLEVAERKRLSSLLRQCPKKLSVAELDEFDNLLSKIGFTPKFTTPGAVHETVLGHVVVPIPAEYTEADESADIYAVPDGHDYLTPAFSATQESTYAMASEAYATVNRGEQLYDMASDYLAVDDKDESQPVYDIGTADGKNAATYNSASKPVRGGKQPQPPIYDMGSADINTYVSASNHVARVVDELQPIYDMGQAVEEADSDFQGPAHDNQPSGYLMVGDSEDDDAKILLEGDSEILAEGYGFEGIDDESMDVKDPLAEVYDNVARNTQGQLRLKPKLQEGLQGESDDSSVGSDNRTVVPTGIIERKSFPKKQPDIYAVVTGKRTTATINQQKANSHSAHAFNDSHGSDDSGYSNSPASSPAKVVSRPLPHKPAASGGADTAAPTLPQRKPKKLENASTSDVEVNVFHVVFTQHPELTSDQFDTDKAVLKLLENPNLLDPRNIFQRNPKKTAAIAFFFVAAAAAGAAFAALSSGDKKDPSAAGNDSCDPAPDLATLAGMCVQAAGAFKNEIGVNVTATATITAEQAQAVYQAIKHIPYVIAAGLQSYNQTIVLNMLQQCTGAAIARVCAAVDFAGVAIQNLTTAVITTTRPIFSSLSSMVPTTTAVKTTAATIATIATQISTLVTSLATTAAQTAATEISTLATQLATTTAQISTLATQLATTTATTTAATMATTAAEISTLATSIATTTAEISTLATAAVTTAATAAATTTAAAIESTAATISTLAAEITTLATTVATSAATTVTTLASTAATTAAATTTTVATSSIAMTTTLTKNFYTLAANFQGDCTLWSCEAIRAVRACWCDSVNFANPHPEYVIASQDSSSCKIFPKCTVEEYRQNGLLP